MVDSPAPTAADAPTDPPGESSARIDDVQERIDSARDAAGHALTDRAEESHPLPTDTPSADGPV